jgi:hypothetical protein
MLPLAKAGTARAVIDNLVATAFVLDDSAPLSKAAQIVDAIDVWFGLSLQMDDVQSSIDRLLAAGSMSSVGRRLVLTPMARAQIESQIERSHALEEHVHEEWSADLRTSGVSDKHVGQLWQILRGYMARAFLQYGALTIQLLDPAVPTTEADTRSLAVFLNEAYEEAGSDVSRDVARNVVSEFFSRGSLERVVYISQLLDGTFTFFALSVDDRTAEYLKSKLPPLLIFLDTNFILALLDMGENPMTGAVKELFNVIKAGGFPFKLYCHERTLKELEDTVAIVRDRLSGRAWTQALSRAAIAGKVVSGIELAYHRLNAESPVSSSVFVEKWDHIRELLNDRGIKLYRAPNDECYSVERKGELIAEYLAFVERDRPDRPRPYASADHDITVWLTVQNKHTDGRSALQRGAIFLSLDFLFYRFDWEVLRDDRTSGSVVLPSPFLQVLRQYLPTSTNYAQSFLQTFSVPEFRSAYSNYAETKAEVLSYLRMYQDVGEESAVRILTDQLLLEQLSSAPRGSPEFGEQLESAVLRDHQVLVEEAEAIKRAAERLQREKDQTLAESVRRIESLEVENQMKLERVQHEHEQAAAAKAAEEEESRREIAERHTTEIHVKEGEVKNLRLAKSEGERRLATTRAQVRVTIFALVFVVGAVIAFVVPAVTHWHWLEDRGDRISIYGLVLVTWACTCWSLALKKRSAALLAFIGAAIIALLTAL